LASKAIVIGCAAYMSDGIPDLRYAEQDAQAIHDRLIDPDIGGFDPEKTNLLISPIHVGTSVQLEALLHGAAPDDSVLVYFAGHGLRDDRGQMYLAVADTNPEFLRATSISARFVRELLDDCLSRKVCVILDCCFSGAFGQGQRSVLNAGDVQAALGTLEGEGTIVLTSSQASQQSRESERYKHGTFTHYLLEGLDGAADTDSNGLITPFDLYQFVSGRMERESGAAQRPMLLGSLAGGSFPIARSSLKRQRALDGLEAEVASLAERRRHLAAIRKIQSFAPSNPKEMERIGALEKRVQSDMVGLLREFKKKLYAEGGEGLLTGKVLHQADKILSSHGGYLFDEIDSRATDPCEVLLRNHFLGRIDAAAMQDLWPKDAHGDSTDLALSLTRLSDPNPVNLSRVPLKPAGGNETPEPSRPPADVSPANSNSPPTSVAKTVSPANDSWWRSPLYRRMAVGVLWIGTLAVIGTWVYKTRASSTYERDNIKLGVLLKTDWTDPDAKAIFAEVGKQLNQRMPRDEHSKLKYHLKDEVKTYASSDLDKVVDALRTGEIDIAGELAPWDIYEANRRANAEPFISAMYDGRDTYNSTVFMRRDSSLVKWQGSEIDRVATWQEVLVQLDQGSKIAVSRDPSTSGYWYPRYMVLTGFALLDKRQRSFDDVAERLDNEQILARVACGSGKIIAGVVARFRFESAKKQPCGGQDVDLVSVRESDPIKHGAFVVRQKLAEDPTLMENLKQQWPYAVAAVEITTGTVTLEKNWQHVDLKYYENTKPVFEQPDPVVKRRLQVIVAACALLVIATAGYLWLSARRGAGVAVQP